MITKTKSILEMSIEQKLIYILDSPHTITIGNGIMRSDGEWHGTYEWKHVQLPNRNHIADGTRFLKLDDCLDNCIEYLKELKNKKKGEQ
jgi:hypothetical protein